jgi:membrane protein involved in D-alanine export
MLTPYANFLYFGLLLSVVLPTIILGLFGRANGRWALCATLLVIGIQSAAPLRFGHRWEASELWAIVAFTLYQGGNGAGVLRWKSRTAFYAVILLAVVPLVLAKALPMVRVDHSLGFLGISYVTFRALDVLFSIRDGLINTLPATRYFTFLFFFPTVSSGPIDRYRRFNLDWQHVRSRAEFLNDLDLAVARIFRGFLYKFIIAALIKTYWLDRLQTGNSLFDLAAYMYGYSFYLFFDFAGYSAFAVGFSTLFGIRIPENFDLPFVARNIRDFWNRWHITLSFWFRDHIYMRFLLAATKGKWFGNKNVASYVGLFLTFGVMGLWHGTATHYIVYGLYHATLLCAYDAHRPRQQATTVSRDRSVVARDQHRHHLSRGLFRIPDFFRTSLLD